jgi:lipopolysaccharide biosynthesis regulator YciM
MTTEEIVSEIDKAAREEAGTIFANIFASQVSGKRGDHQTAVDNCISSLRLLNTFQTEVTKRLEQT